MLLIKDVEIIYRHFSSQICKCIYTCMIYGLTILHRKISQRTDIFMHTFNAYV